MPKRKGLNIGVGIASGVQGFLDSYLRMTQIKQQQKLTENSFIIQALTEQLKDENLPLRQRAKILDSIPKLVGIKHMDRRLSEMFGLDDVLLNEPQEEAISGKQGTSDTSLVDPNAVEHGMASSITLKGKQATQDIPASLEKKGELTPALIKKKLILETKKAEDVQDIEKQSKLLKINYDLQKASLKGEGFTKEVFRGYDRNGNYIVTMINQKGERKDIFLGDVDPDSIIKAGITANKPSKFLQERERYWLNQVNPETGMNYSEQEANMKALEDANKQFQLKLETGEAYKTSVTQGITGTKPIQPSQETDDRRALAERRSILRANVNTMKRQALDASLDARNKSQQATDQWSNVVEPIKREMQKWLDDGGETIDIEYTRQQTRLNTEINRYNELKKAADDAVAKDNSLKESVRESEEILQGFEGEVGSSNAAPSNLKSIIDVVRRDNPSINDPKSASYMTDDQIIQYLRKKGRIK